MSESESQPLKQGKVYTQGLFLRRIKWIARTFGILTVVVLIAATYVTIYEDKDKDDKESYVGWYLIPVTFLVTIFEAAWILNKFACCSRESCCCACWSIVLWVDNWKKFIFYIVISVPLFLEGMRKILGIASGFCLVFLGILYLLKTFYNSQESYEVIEKQFISTKSPIISKVTSEISTQTDRENVFPKENEKENQAYSNPFDNGDKEAEKKTDGKEGE